jgi:cytochrome c-type biogenesis protein CcmH
MRKIVFLLLLMLLALSAFGSIASPTAAQTPTPNEINAVAKDLWCPLCNGVRLDNCELQACVQMRELIGQKLAAGESKESIKAYFVQQYGDVVLGQPPREGFNLIAYIFPILAAVVGIGWVVYLVLSWRRRQTATVAAAASRPAPSGPAAPRKPGEDPEDYMKRVERELRDTE